MANPRIPARRGHKHQVDKLLSDTLTQGDILYVNSSGELALLPVGSDNQILAVDGSDVVWETGAGGGASQLSDLSDVNTSTPTNRNALVADGVDWESRALVEADISDLGSYITDVTGDNLSALADVTITGIASGELLKWNGSAWINNTLAEAGIQAAGSYLTDVLGDTTPQLGGNLDVNSNKIVSVSNGDIDIEPNGTGNVLLGNMSFDADQTIGAGQDNYVLTYDNATGNISLEAASGGGISNVVEDTTPQLGGDLDGQGNNLDSMGVIFLNEQASADADVAGDGQLWVKSDAPNTLYFTDDTGLDWKAPKEQIKYKTATTSTSTDTTYTDDPHLAGFNLEDDTWYMVEGYFELTSALSVDIKFRGNLSNTEQAGSWTITGRNSGGTNEGDHGTNIGSTNILIDTNNTNNHGFVVYGFIQSNATTGGTFAVQWAQNTSDAATTSLLLGSWLKLTKLS